MARPSATANFTDRLINLTVAYFVLVLAQQPFDFVQFHTDLSNNSSKEYDSKTFKMQSFYILHIPILHCSARTHAF